MECWEKCHLKPCLPVRIILRRYPNGLFWCGRHCCGGLNRWIYGTSCRNNPQLPGSIDENLPGFLCDLTEWRMVVGVRERKMTIRYGKRGKRPFEVLLTRLDYSPGVAQRPFLVREGLLWRAYSRDVWNQLQEQPRVAREYERDFAGFFVSFDGMENGGGLVSLPAVQREMEMIRDEVPGGD